MNTKETFLRILNQHLKSYRLYQETATNVLLQEKERFDFDIDSTFAEWCNTVSVDCLIIDVATANQKDIEAIETHWNHPTAYLFKNFGDERAGNYRNKISCFIKDRCFSFSCPSNPEPQVVLCFTTVSKDKPIKDFYEQQVFFDHYDF